MSETVTLPADTNQAPGIARYAVDFMSDLEDDRRPPPHEVPARTGPFPTHPAQAPFRRAPWDPVRTARILNSPSWNSPNPSADRRLDSGFF